MQLFRQPRLRAALTTLPVLGAIAIPLGTPQSAFADTLKNWQVTPSQFEFTTDQAVQPQVQIVPNPTRVVIDLPGIRWKGEKINQSQTGAVQTLRIARFEKDTTRIVLDLQPGQTIDPNQVVVKPKSARQWTIQLPPPQSAIALPLPVGNDIAIDVPPAPAPKLSNAIPQGQNLAWLQQRLAKMVSEKQYADLDPGAFILDLDTGNYASINGNKVQPTASVIKLPILVAFLQDVEAGKIRLNETLTMTRDVIVGGSGYMQDAPVNSRYSALETLTNMMVTSDNTATNMIIKRMGGINYVNQRFAQWGLPNTRIRNWLPDLRGTNTTTAQEMVKVMGMLEQGELLSSQKQTALNIMQRIRNRSLLPQGLGRGARIAHKTGDIGFLLGDSGIVYMPNGKRYLISVLVGSRVYDDYDAMYYIREMSGIVYSYMTNLSNANVATVSNPTANAGLVINSPGLSGNRSPIDALRLRLGR